MEPGTTVNECFANVELKIERDGGSREIGWQIWEWPNVYIEAEFHAVWVSPDSHRVDVTPKQIPVDRILFLPDLSLTYSKRQVDNIRQALRDDKLIRDFIRISETIFRVENKGDRANQLGVIEISRHEIEPLIKAREFLFRMLREGLGEHSLCGCNSGRKYKNCCGAYVNRLLKV